MSEAAFAHFAEHFEVLEFISAIEAVHLSAALPKFLPTRRPRWFPAAAMQQAGRMASGRGLSQADARVSCLGEAAELVSTCFRGDESLLRACWRDVADHAVHPNQLTLISPAQFRNRDKWNRENGRIDWLPNRFDERRPIDWVEATSPDGEDRALTPAAHVYLGYFERGNEDAFDVADSNGCAAGETADAACVSAFLELVERDAVAMWWYGRHSRPAFPKPFIDEGDDLLAALNARSRALSLLDLTTDFGIPVCAAISAEADGRVVAIGTAAHFDARRAKIAALTEMLQTELSLALRCRTESDDLDPFGYWLRHVACESMPYLLPSGASPLPHAPNVPATFENCDAACRKLGLRLLVVDLTRPEIGIPVFRIIVPGLRARQRRLADGRLFDVPVQLGWCRSQLAAERANSVPMVV